MLTEQLCTVCVLLFTEMKVFREAQESSISETISILYGDLEWDEERRKTAVPKGARKSSNTDQKRHKIDERQQRYQKTVQLHEQSFLNSCLERRPFRFLVCISL